MLLGMLDEVSSEFIQLALTSVNFLARSVVADLEEPVFEVIFSTKWEKENMASLGLITVRTLEDYFTDVTTWLPSYFFSKVCRTASLYHVSCVV